MCQKIGGLHMKGVTVKEQGCRCKGYYRRIATIAIYMQYSHFTDSLVTG